MLNLFCQKCGRLVEVEPLDAPDKDGNLGACPVCGTPLTPNRFIPPGSDVNGFVIEHEIGRGGMGVVYLARQTSLDRKVALKILSDEMASDEQFIQAFFREARAAAGLNHPNIVQAIDTGVAPGGIYYFAMELIEGENLECYTAARGAMPLQLGLRCAIRISEALAYAWNHKKLVHRDIKPENIILKDGTDFKLADLGLAKDFRDASSAPDGNDSMATPAYASPEVIRRETEKIGFKSDMYSFGATLYQIFTGHPPFPGGDPAEVCEKQLNEQPKPLIGVNPGLPFPLSMLVDKLMEKDPGKRPATWDAVHKELIRIAAAKHSAAPFPKPPSTSPVPEKHATPLWLKVLSPLLLLAAGCVLFFLFRSSPSAPAPQKSMSAPPPRQTSAADSAISEWEPLKKKLSLCSDPYSAYRELHAYLKKAGANAPDEANRMHRELKDGPMKEYLSVLEELYTRCKPNLSAEIRGRIQSPEKLREIQNDMILFFRTAKEKRDWSAEKYPDSILAHVKSAAIEILRDLRRLEKEQKEKKEQNIQRERKHAMQEAFRKICRELPSGTQEKIHQDLWKWKQDYKDVITSADEYKIHQAEALSETLALSFSRILQDASGELQHQIILPRTLPGYRFYKTNEDYLYCYPADVPKNNCRKKMKKFPWKKLNLPENRKRIISDFIFGSELNRIMPLPLRKALFEQAVFQQIPVRHLKKRFFPNENMDKADQKKIFSCLNFLPPDMYKH